MPVISSASPLSAPGSCEVRTLPASDCDIERAVNCRGLNVAVAAAAQFVRRECPLCAEQPRYCGLPAAIPFGVPTYWSPETALAIFEFIDEMRDIVLAVYATHIDDAARKQWHSPTDNPAVVPDDELPF